MCTISSYYNNKKKILLYLIEIYFNLHVGRCECWEEDRKCSPVLSCDWQRLLLITRIELFRIKYLSKKSTNSLDDHHMNFPIEQRLDFLLTWLIKDYTQKKNFLNVHVFVYFCLFICLFDVVVADWLSIEHYFHIYNPIFIQWKKNE